MDRLEEELLKRFAPQLHFHHTEKCFPSSVPWYLERVKMRYTHKKCSDCPIIPYGKVTVDNITEQRHRNKGGWLNACSHKGSNMRSDGYSPSDIKTGFFLQQHDWTHYENPHESLREVYGHVYPGNNFEGIVVQYWFFYTYNDWLNNHEGDWEHITILLDKNLEKPKRLYYSQHHNGGVYDNVLWVENGVPAGEKFHPKVFVASGSHANYPRAIGGKCVGSSYSENCNSYRTWSTWKTGKIINVGERHYPMSGCNWIKYSGRWGEIGLIDVSVGPLTLTEGTGPKGPTYQRTSWNRWR